MLVYNFLIVLILLILCYNKVLNIKTNKKKEDRLSIIIFIALLIVSAFRDMVGTDFLAYKSYIENIKLYSINNSLYEKGYYLLNNLVFRISDNSQYIFVFVSFIILYLIHKTLKRYSISYTLSMFLFVTLYFYYNSFNIIRQYISIAIVFFSIKYLINRNLKKFLICIFIATMFHMTALLILPFYWIVNKRFNSIVYLSVIILTILISFLSPILISLILKIFPKYSLYLNTTFTLNSNKSIIIIIALVFIYSYLNINKINKVQENGIILINLTFFALIFAILSSKNIMIYRVTMYFYTFIILLIPICIEIIDKRIKPLVYYILILSLWIYNIYMLTNNNAGVYPYSYNFILELKPLLILNSIWIINCIYNFLYKKFILRGEKNESIIFNDSI
ncbi:EpsG family protein [Clostridium perfringens]